MITNNKQQTLTEGIDINFAEKTVSYNDGHQKNVDTSEINNPTVDDVSIPGVKIWSAFKRKESSEHNADGNPLLYALKGIGGWKFKTPGDEYSINRQLDMIISKFANEHRIGLTIVIPSSSKLNTDLANRIRSVNHDTMIIDDVICKLNTREVWDIVMDENSDFRRTLGSDPEKLNSMLKELSRNLKKMDEEKGSVFTRHMVKNPEIRNLLSKTLKFSDDPDADYSYLINGRDILVLDDTVSRGQTIKEACDILNTSYFPKSITVFTIMSKKYDEDPANQEQIRTDVV